MKTRVSGVLLLLSSIGLFVFALTISQREAATACWVASTILLLSAAMLLLGSIVGSSSVTAGDSSSRRRHSG